ncbi:unnamed protein product [Prorocentrum cordatum]|uniref:Uncharacterized protein n=1 Tax=Prorocentrum cordatum TaxID=2364126 RepID=A0ABN9RX35_9DINO|nr:unnamed protein product [Polarella glacialis]
MWDLISASRARIVIKRMLNWRGTELDRVDGTGPCTFPCVAFVSLICFGLVPALANCSSLGHFRFPLRFQPTPYPASLCTSMLHAAPILDRRGSGMVPLVASLFCEWARLSQVGHTVIITGLPRATARHLRAPGVTIGSKYFHHLAKGPNLCSSVQRRATLRFITAAPARMRLSILR